jgi:lathosterol oxidase
VSIALAHCGYELFPRGFSRVPVLGWYVTPLVHDAHHSRVDVNYGATLNLFDRLLGTFRAPGEPAR